MEERWTEGWMERRTEGQRDPTNPDKPSRQDWGSNKTFAYIFQGINHITQSLFIMTSNA